MTNQEIKNFLETHRDIEYSAAKFEYSMYNYTDLDKNYLEMINAKNTLPEDIETESLICSAHTGEELLRLMRKPTSLLNRCNLRQKLLTHEDIMLPLIKEKALRNLQDEFIENALYFFLHSKTNIVDWFMDNYKNFRSEYLKSMFCLILGFRGEKELIPFLMKEADRFERLYPEEDFDQGPVLAVQELAFRFMNWEIYERV